MPQPGVDLPNGVHYEVVGLAYEQPVDLTTLGITPTAVPATPYVRSSDQEQNDRPGNGSDWARNNDRCFWVEFPDDSVSRLVCWHLDQQKESDGAQRYYQFHLDAIGSGHNQ